MKIPINSICQRRAPAYLHQNGESPITMKEKKENKSGDEEKIPNDADARLKAHAIANNANEGKKRKIAATKRRSQTMLMQESQVTP